MDQQCWKYESSYTIYQKISKKKIVDLKTGFLRIFVSEDL